MSFKKKKNREYNDLAFPQMRLSCLSEPELSFADGTTHINPKIGIPLYGPKSLNTPRHKKEMSVY